MLFGQLNLLANDSLSLISKAVRIKGQSPTIDGLLLDSAWQIEPAISQLIQKDPQEGEKCFENTEIKFIYDDYALYIACRMYRKNTNDIIAIVSRRDNSVNSERIIISLDTYQDKKTAFTFSITASGVRTEYTHINDGEFDRDYSYNPVWEAKTNIDSLGWTAEMRIPFSQLRFHDNEQIEWGLNINKWTPSYREDAYWSMIPKSQTGWSSKFGKLIGINGIKNSKRIELIPYFIGTSSIYPSELKDEMAPFYKNSVSEFNAGLDFKMGLGPNLTLDATINPDFGQVEADPAVVNLTAFESYFEEKRPFFVENRNSYNAGSNVFFYSRRIGASPKFRSIASSTNPGNSQVAEQTRILAAAKLSGKIAESWNLALLTAVTDKEIGKFVSSIDNKQSDFVAEPLSSFSVLRLDKEFANNSGNLGFLLTQTIRKFDDNDAIAKLLNKNAYSFLTDWSYRFDSSKYEFKGNFGLSYIQGSKDAILARQMSSARYLQRYDRVKSILDSNLTSMTGMTSAISFEKKSGEHWTYYVGVNTYTPMFETNDLGILNEVDFYAFDYNIKYVNNVPKGGIYQWLSKLRSYQRFNFEHYLTSCFFESNNSMTLLDRSNIWFKLIYQARTYNEKATRGGPMLFEPYWKQFQLGYNSDFSRNFNYSLVCAVSESQFDARELQLYTTLVYRFSGSFEINFEPSFRLSSNTIQYIQTLANGNPLTNNKSYIFGNLDQVTLSVQLRLNYAITPDFTIEYYAEPFGSQGTYSKISELANASSYNFAKFETQREEDGSLQLKLNNRTHTISNPDFNILSFRSNLVLRWEWTRGSTMFLVWQQNMNNNMPNTTFYSPTNLFGNIFERGISTVAFKINYWLPID